ncbi:MAG TPA: tetraacyldisaccharide 4'-kinase [Rhizomicrobium sp.]|jgi:tetraacyldisaccharide 4'-kinase|nr:tetraacyldisaccharide 4'-kinase [Rhizomicrobium sp.]
MRAPEFWRKDGAVARLLAPLGALYGLSVALKARYARPFDPGIPVICVGNLTAGGSGKTPVAITIADLLRARGHRPYFLTRGYGGTTRGPALASRGHSAAVMGDEALLLARAAPTIVARDRAAGARLAKEKGATVLVMDDGHQNFSLRKNLSLVVVDAETGFGNGFQIPAGPLREPVAQGLSRADAVVLVGSERSKDGRAAKRAQEGSTLNLGDFSGVVLRARLLADGSAFAGQQVFAFAGIGRPEKFIASLEELGAVIIGRCFFADHHPYTDDEILELKALAGDAMPVTTEKDFVRLSTASREGIRMLKVAAAFDDGGVIARLLDSAVPRP